MSEEQPVPAQSSTLRLTEDSSFTGISAVVRPAEPDVRLGDIGFGVSRIEIRRESARQLVSVIIVSALLFIVVASFIVLVILVFKSDPSPSIADLRQLLEVLLAPVVGIVGAVTGFYFGSGSATR